jgi:uncharacterized protein
MQFEWDRNKNECNLRKHGVDFEETMSVFDDIFAVIIEDRFHSNSEQREIIVGRSSNGRFLYVVFVESENSICIISARKLTPAERRRYEQRKSE